MTIEDADHDEIAIDAPGYTGNIQRERPDEKTLKPIKFEELVQIIN